MDVVLIGKESKDNGKDVVLFLESKFAEYYLYANKKSEDISERYRGGEGNEYTKIIYEPETLNRLGLKTECSKKKNHFYLNSEETFYVNGIKQMISHYCGIRNIMAENYFDKESDEFRQKEIQDVVKAKIKNGAVVILGEIVFDYKIGELEIPLRGKVKQKCICAYCTKYKALAKGIASLTKDVPNFEIVTDLLKYSDIKKIMEEKMEDKIKAFYYGK